MRLTLASSSVYDVVLRHTPLLPPSDGGGGAAPGAPRLQVQSIQPASSLDSSSSVFHHGSEEGAGAGAGAGAVRVRAGGQAREAHELAGGGVVHVAYPASIAKATLALLLVRLALLPGGGAARLQALTARMDARRAVTCAVGVTGAVQTEPGSAAASQAAAAASLASLDAAGVFSSAGCSCVRLAAAAVQEARARAEREARELALALQESAGGGQGERSGAGALMSLFLPPPPKARRGAPQALGSAEEELAHLQHCTAACLAYSEAHVYRHCYICGRLHGVDLPATPRTCSSDACTAGELSQLRYMDLFTELCAKGSAPTALLLDSAALAPPWTRRWASGWPFWAACRSCMAGTQQGWRCLRRTWRGCAGG